MASIYKALMRASEERKAQERPAVLSGKEVGGPPNTPRDTEEEMLKLLESIESLPIRARKKVIQFVGSHDGKRASILAREFAEASASGVGLSVLLVEHERPRTRFGSLFGRNQTPDGLVANRRLRDIDRTIRQVKGKNLFICPQIEEGNARSLVAATGSSPPFLARIKESFDLVVIPSDHENGSSEPPAIISPHADAVVLVFESELTDSRTPEDPNDLGMASVLENIAQGRLIPQRTMSCLGVPLLLLTLPATDSSLDHLGG